MNSNEWTRHKLDDLYDIHSETAVAQRDFENDCLHISQRYIMDNYFLQDDGNRAVNGADEEIYSGSVKKGDIFWAVQKKINMTSVALEDFETVTFSRFLKQLRLKKKFDVFVDPVFLAYYLRSPFIYRQIDRNSSLTIRFNLSNEIIRNLEIRLPAKQIQIKIGEVLKFLDDKITNNLRICDTLNEIIKTAFKEWFLLFRAPGVCKNIKDSELGAIPQDWNVSSIDDLGEFQTGYPFKSEDFQKEGNAAIVKIKNIGNHVVDLINTDYVDRSVVEKLNEKYKIKSGSLLIAMSGSESGKVALIPVVDKNLWLNQRVGMVNERVPFGSFFLYLLLSANPYQQVLRNAASGTAQPNISVTAIEHMRFIAPPAELIIQFGEKIYPIFETILNYTAENENLKEIRSRLLFQLMSAKVNGRGVISI